MAAVSTSSSDALELVRGVCPSCHGFGSPAATQPACIACGEQWTYARFDQWIEAYDRPTSWLSWLLPGRRNRYLWDKLPCGHDLGFLTHAESICLTCRGVGTVASLQLSRRYEQRQRALLTATAPRPHANRAAPSPMRTPAPRSRLATAPVSAYAFVRRR